MHSQPVASPAHAGGLFTIDRRWFDHLGQYDPGLQIWGSENIELSLKARRAMISVWSGPQICVSAGDYSFVPLHRT